MNEQALKDRIRDLLATAKKGRIRRRELFRMLDEPGLEYDDFKDLLRTMERTGDIERAKGRQFGIPGKTAGTFTGTFSLTRNGGGTIRTAKGESIYVLPRNTGGALTGDTVSARMVSRTKVGMSPTAKVAVILERSTEPIIGVFRQVKRTTFIEPRDTSFKGNLLVKDIGGFDPHEGDVVMAKVTEGVDGFTQPFCIITEVLGPEDSPGVDVLAITRHYKLPIAFPEAVLAEAAALPDDLTPEIIAKRRDIRGLVTVTIDPVDAKDFDDAVSVEKLPDGSWRLGVHIADVAHYVKEGSALDVEAKARGLSCYLVDRVIPMLPERLSNDLCSLRPNEDRLTKSVFTTVDAMGSLSDTDIADTVINSDMRLTYEQVQAFLEGRKEDGAEKITPPVGTLLTELATITNLFIKRRNARGALNFKNPEAHVYLDELGRPLTVVKHEQKMAHRMIEEAMIMANVAVSRTLAARQAPFLYRVHEEPDPVKLALFAEIAEALGHPFAPAKAMNDRTYIQKFLDSLEGSPRERTINMLLLRSMKRAVYSPVNHGHFGLALKTYSHFTSPIRRYPDLLLHRQIDNYLGSRHGRPVEHDLGWYQELGDHVTEREMTSDSAERESVKMKSAEFMKERLGEDYDGTITGVIPAGFFVEIDDFFIEGLVHVSTLYNDYYDLNRTGIALVGKSTGQKFTLGDRVRVKVVAADKNRHEIDFILVKRLK